MCLKCNHQLIVTPVCIPEFMWLKYMFEQGRWIDCECMCLITAVYEKNLKRCCDVVGNYLRRREYSYFILMASCHIWPVESPPQGEKQTCHRISISWMYYEFWNWNPMKNRHLHLTRDDPIWAAESDLKLNTFNYVQFDESFSSKLSFMKHNINPVIFCAVFA